MAERSKRNDDKEIFDRQYEVYKESFEQRGESEEQAEAEAAEKLKTGRGEPGGAHSNRE